nr:hypothetical protein [Eikenella glucosivorans]
MPLHLVESKVVQGLDNHPQMTAEVWKKIPEWVDKPAAVFESDTDKDRLVFIAPEKVAGRPVRIIIEPNGNHLEAHILVNAYDANSRMPWQRWVRDGLLKYMDMANAHTVLGSSGSNAALPTRQPSRFGSSEAQSFRSQLNGMLAQSRGRKKILTEKNLQGYLKNNPALSVNPSRNTQSTATPERVAEIRQQVERAVGRRNMRLIEVLTAEEASRPNGAQDLRGVEGWYDPQSKRITLIADNLPNARTAQFAAWHELGHRKIDVAGWQQWRGVLEQARLNPTIKQLAQTILRQRKAAGEAINFDQATEEAAVELYSAMKNSDYAALEDKYKVSVPLAMRSGLAGYFSRFAKRLQAVLARAFGIQHTDFGDHEVFELLRKIDRAEENNASPDARQQRAIEQGFMTEQQWEDLLNERLQPGRMAGRDGDTRSTGTSPAEQRGMGAGAGEGAVGSGTRRADTTPALRHFFHGTHADVSAFDLDHPGRKDHGWLGTGVYLTDNPDAAEAYAYAKGRRNEGGQNVMPLAIKLENPYIADKDLKTRMQHTDRQTADALTRRLQEMGHDGVILKLGDDAHEVVVFDPANVRSVHAQFAEDKAGENGLLYSRSVAEMTDKAKPGWLDRNELGEWEKGLALYHGVGRTLKPLLAKLKLANTAPQEFTEMMRDYRSQR